MFKQDNAQRLEQDWERAVQAARENNAPPQPLADETLGAAAGLQVKVHLRAGQYPTQDLMSNCCTGHNCL